MSKGSRNLLFVLLPWAVSAIATADVLVVDASSGPFTDLQAAVDAAQPGDALLVKSGSYTTFLVNAKPLAIVGDEGADVQIVGAVRVRSLPRDSVLLLSNLNATGTSGTSSARYGLYVVDNQGAIRVSNSSFRGAAGAGGTQKDGADGLYCQLSADLVVTRCELTGGAGLNGLDDAGTSGAGARITGSTVAFYDCTLEGGDGQVGITNFAPDGGHGGAGLRAQDATLFLSGCSAHGGDGGNGSNPGQPLFSLGGNGGDGLWLQGNSLAVLLDVPANGGLGGEIWVGIMQQGHAPDGADRVGSQFVDLPGSARELQASAVVRNGSSLALTLRGEPGDRVGLWLDRRTVHVFWGLFSGVLIVPITFPPFALWLGTLPGTGTMVVSLPIAWLAGGDVEDVLFLQPAFRTPSGSVRVGSGLGVTVLDPAF